MYDDESFVYNVVLKILKKILMRLRPSVMKSKRSSNFYRRLLLMGMMISGLNNIMDQFLF